MPFSLDEAAIYGKLARTPKGHNRTSIRGRSSLPGRRGPRGQEGRPPLRLSNFEDGNRGPGTHDVDPDRWLPLQIKIRRTCLGDAHVFLMSRRLAFLFLKTDAVRRGFYVHVM